MKHLTYLASAQNITKNSIGTKKLLVKVNVIDVLVFLLISKNITSFNKVKASYFVFPAIPTKRPCTWNKSEVKVSYI